MNVRLCWQKKKKNKKIKKQENKINQNVGFNKKINKILNN